MLVPMTIGGRGNVGPLQYTAYPGTLMILPACDVVYGCKSPFYDLMCGIISICACHAHKLTACIFALEVNWKQRIGSRHTTKGYTNSMTRTSSSQVCIVGCSNLWTGSLITMYSSCPDCFSWHSASHVMSDALSRTLIVPCAHKRLRGRVCREC